MRSFAKIKPLRKFPNLQYSLGSNKIWVKHKHVEDSQSITKTCKMTPSPYKFFHSLASFYYFLGFLPFSWTEVYCTKIIKIYIFSFLLVLIAIHYYLTILNENRKFTMGVNFPVDLCVWKE